MKPLAVIAAALVAAPLAACDNEQVKACEASLVADLKSPASYKRVDVTELDNPGYKTPYHEVVITYDAANSYNALLRDKRTCWYKPGTTDHVDPFGFDSINDATDMNATDMNATDMNATDLNVSADAAADAAEAAIDRSAEAVDDASNAIEAAKEQVNEDEMDLNAAPGDE